ncbi:MAG: ATP-binding cassette domain-containing protein [Desulfobacterales bacterium]|jgi:putative phosphonate transport system ATP-binding protein|nr:ATP-binding cassette domain-containing protein [Desulfobacterales bacterium]
MTLPPPIVQVRGLTRRFGTGCPACPELTGPAAETNQCPRCRSVTACREVSFELHSGEVLGIVGESGSGKSTVVRLLHFDLAPTAGEYRLNLNGAAAAGLPWLEPGQNLFELGPHQRRQLRNRLMGIVYQNPLLGLRLKVTAGGNIAERLLMAGWRRVERMRERAADLLARTEVPVERMDELPRHFSGGMQQRVQIAKALSTDPAVLLLDEVTTGLDVSVQARVLDLIRSLQRELQIATIVVSHDLGVIRMLTTRTLVMRYGGIVEQGLSDQILEDPQHPYTQLLVNSTL